MNTATTTIAPIHVKEPPAAIDWSHALRMAFRRPWKCLSHWFRALISHTLLVATAVAMFALVNGVGVLASRGYSGLTASLCRLLQETASAFAKGMMTVASVWVLSIVLASELVPFAQRLEDHTPLLTALASVCGIVCICSTLHHVFSLSKLRRTLPNELAPQVKDQGTSRCFTSIAAVIGALLTPLERPVSTWAIGSTIESSMSNWYLVKLALPEIWAWVVPEMWAWVASPIPLATVIAGSALLLGCCCKSCSLSRRPFASIGLKEPLLHAPDVIDQV